MALPTFIEKDYQQLALERFEQYLTALEQPRANFEKVLRLKQEHPELILQLPDFGQEAWARVHPHVRPKNYSPRVTGDGIPVPNLTFKVPTAGGKTYLATAAVTRLVTGYLRPEEPRVVLWIMPSEAIFSQTKAYLTDREHPYRQLLDRASGGRVRILEKDSPLNRDEMMQHLNILLLMLPSAAKKDAEKTLRLFRQNGSVTGFFPHEDDRQAHMDLVAQIPNLHYIQQGVLGDETVGMVRNSVGNVLRLLRPIIVMDEGQKAFSDLSHRTLYDFNPRFVLELSATPKDADERWANWLTNIRGTDLHREQMIKMPLILHSRETGDWRDCLRRAWEKTESLQREAEDLRANTARYIRPILLVQVERTGKQQLDGDEIHAYQAREYLQSLGVSAEAIKLKTAEENEIARVNLLAEDCPVRVIITKSALQEGWDCSFAYVLCSLIPANAVSGMQQMVGRILRQPEATFTGRQALDQCYVFTHFPQTARVFEAIKKGLEGEGMGDLHGKIRLDTDTPDRDTLVRSRREAFQGIDYYLPTVAVVDRGTARDFDWECDVLAYVPWEDLDVRSHASGLSKSLATQYEQVTEIGLNVITGDRSRVIESREYAPAKFDLTYCTRVLNKDIPNPFVAAKVLLEFTEELQSNGWSEDDVILHQRYITREVQKLCKTWIDQECRKAFEAGVENHRIRFNLRTAGGWWKVPMESEVALTGLQGRVDGQGFQASLFDPVQQGEMNSLELQVASFVDKHGAVDWWYRNVVHNGYHLQAWLKKKIYPDFILARSREGAREWVLLETKGGHLADNPDTAYKREAAKRLGEIYEAQRELEPIGELQLIEDGQTFSCNIVMDDEWEAELSAILAPV